ncbi:MAG: ABC transporter ATP-binding protein [Oscillospiraceae bacterium]|nr:ABC transporter ATP-binding protein [Oscillospiraceae bacterium]
MRISKKTYLKMCKKELFFFFLSSVAWAGVGVSLAFLLQHITDAVTGHQVKSMYIVVGIAVLYLLADVFLDFALSYSGIVLRKKLSQMLRDSVVERIFKCSIEEKDEKGDAHYLSLLNNNIDAIEIEYIHGILMVIAQIFSLIFALIATTLIQPIMTVIVIVLCALPVFIPRLLKNKLEKTNREALSQRAKYLDFLNDMMEGFQTIKSFGSEAEVNSHHKKNNAKITKIMKYSLMWKRVSMSLSYGMGNAVVIASWIVGGIFVFKGSIAVPQLIALTTLMNMIAGPFQIISEYYAEIVSGNAILNDLFRFINSGNSAGEYKSNDPVINSLSLDGVSVIKNESYILKNASLSIKKGQKIAVIGSSGSGKTTLLKVIAGILHADEGRLSINDRNLDNNDNLSHRDILYIAQNTVVFSATIGENVTLFKGDNEAVVGNAIDKAGLSSWYQRTGCKADTTIDKSSIGLSGGELKRLDFARAIVGSKAVVLFDEPTSGLDQYHARNMMNQLLASEDQTVLIATHNLAEDNISKFDYVYLIEHGEVTAHDDPKKIMMSEKYQALSKGDGGSK